MCDLYLCGGQRTTLRSQFSPSTMWTLGTELRPAGVVKVLLPAESSQQP